MNALKGLYIWTLVSLLILAGCLGGGVIDEGEGQSVPEDGDTTGGSGDSGSGTTTGSTTVVNNYYNYYNNTTSSQETIWYSSGAIVDSYWNDGQDRGNQQERCLEFGPEYDSDTGDYLGEECKRFGYPEGLSDWNTTDCQGDLVWLNNWGQEEENEGNINWKYAPRCETIIASITTNPGEALILKEIKNVEVITTCAGIHFSSIGSVPDSGSKIIPGSALNCIHELTATTYYAESSNTQLNQPKLTSIVYTIQDTIIV